MDIPLGQAIYQAKALFAEYLLQYRRPNRQNGSTHDDHTHEIRNAANDPRYEVHFPPLVIAKTLISDLHDPVNLHHPVQRNERGL